jgi:DNA-binding HxlR family transcriptional regulator
MPAPNDGQSDEPPSDSACSVIDAIQQIGSEWRLVVLYDLPEEAIQRGQTIDWRDSLTLSTRYRLSSEIAGSRVKGK